MTTSSESLWQSFAERHQLTMVQREQFQHFYYMVIEANEYFNLTAIDSLSAFLAHHFDDSLVLGEYSDMSAITTLVDVGTGAGFPGIALKIKYPQVPMVLIEVTHKKIDFLHHVMQTLLLTGIEIYPLDWRTFLRTTTYEANLFCSRASLHPDELIRMFQPGSFYKHARLVYWASRLWKPEGKEKAFLQKEISYKVNHKERKLVFFGLPRQ